MQLSSLPTSISVKDYTQTLNLHEKIKIEKGTNQVIEKEFIVAILGFREKKRKKKNSSAIPESKKKECFCAGGLSTFLVFISFIYASVLRLFLFTQDTISLSLSFSFLFYFLDFFLDNTLKTCLNNVYLKKIN